MKINFYHNKQTPLICQNGRSGMPKYVEIRLATPPNQKHTHKKQLIVAMHATLKHPWHTRRWCDLASELTVAPSYYTDHIRDPLHIWPNCSNKYTSTPHLSRAPSRDNLVERHSFTLRQQGTTQLITLVQLQLLTSCAVVSLEILPPSR